MSEKVREHWTCHAEYVERDDLVAEDENGRLWVPSRKRPKFWDRPLNLRRPTHWPYYLRSRLAGQVAMIETVYVEGELTYKFTPYQRRVNFPKTAHFLTRLNDMTGDDDA